MTAHPLPLASPWFTQQQVGDGLSVLTEPHVHSFLRANIWHLRGADRDLVIDAGLGVASLRQEVPYLFDRDPVLVVTHAHLDHMGGAHEFGTCHLHAAEAAATPAVGALRGEAVASALGLHAGAYARPLPHLLVDAAPTPGFDPDTYELRAPATLVPIDDGHVIDLGDRALTALHLPGHSPGGIALYEPHTGALFSGDVVYDLREGERLLDGITGANVADYVHSLTRLADLPVSVVHPGHGPSFGRDRLLQLIHAYVDERGS
ncbi:MBL fold metallo-hydrolase [Streptomyces acidiscabies]|uniref:MBL fold metallo-hydrolase n=1 Tax=Streptomyces acidiscabies TaxID=42234 RepID=UPI000951A496|nr:MBL fold metallo-hydrolase [Streptomyces acidiscabies]